MEEDTMRRLLICGACVVLILAGCGTTSMASIDPSSFSPPSGKNQGTLYGTVAGANSFEILTSDGRTYSVAVRGSAATPRLFIVVDKARSFSIRKVILHRTDGSDYQWTGIDLPVLLVSGGVGYLGRFTFTNDGHDLSIDRKTEREDLGLLKAVYRGP
jgi:hypothetical protein